MRRRDVGGGETRSRRGRRRQRPARGRPAGSGSRAGGVRDGRWDGDACRSSCSCRQTRKGASCQVNAERRRDMTRSQGIDGRATFEAALAGAHLGATTVRSEEHTSELQSLMRISYAVFCLKKKKKQKTKQKTHKSKHQYKITHESNI